MKLRAQHFRQSHGYAMASVVILSTALLILGGAVLQGALSTRTALLNDYYNRIAREAAEAGVQKATKCIEDNNFSITWTTAAKLQPERDCKGANVTPTTSCAAPGCNRNYVLKNTDLTSTFSVEPTNTNVESQQFTSVGTVRVYNGGGTVQRTITQTLKGSTAQSKGSMLSVGGDNACALSDGNVYCWGYNSFGSLGGNVTDSAGKPVKAEGALTGKTVTELSSSTGNTCAIAKDSASAFGVYCWGNNSDGQLGTGANVQGLPYSATPVAVAMNTGLAGKNLANLAVGNAAVCLTANGDVYCWGSNAYGQLGRGNVGGVYPTPGPALKQTGVLAGRTVTSVSFKDSTVCVIASGGSICWGWNQYAQMGVGNNNNYYDGTPAFTNGPAGSTYLISAGHAHSCSAVTDPGGTKRTYCWGFAGNGRLGEGSTAGIAFSPKEVPALQGITLKSLSSTFTHSCAVSTANTVYCWGSNGYGEIGDPTNLSDRSTPYTVSLSAIGLSGKPIDLVDVAPYRTCIQSQGKFYCWGIAYDGQRDTGVWSPQLVRQDPNDPNRTATGGVLGTTTTKVSVSELNSCALTTGAAAQDKRIFCWGYNYNGQLGINQSFSSKQFSPFALLSGTNTSSYGYTDLNAGGQLLCSIAYSSSFWCWGSDTIGEQGDGNPLAINTQTKPVVSSGALSGKTAQKIATYGNLSCGVASGALYCWGGYNPPALANNGANPEGTPWATAPLPAAAPLDSGVTDVSIGLFYGCAIKSGKLYCWGWNESGQVGDGTRITRNGPVAVQPAPDDTFFNGLTFKKVAVGPRTACAISNPFFGTDVLYCWGYNADGQFGNGTYTGSTTPVVVNGNYSNSPLVGKKLTDISLGTGHACAIADNQVYCWGYNVAGQLGNGTTMPSALPVLVGNGTGTTPVFTNSNVTSISAGNRTTCAVQSGRTYCWGSNTQGQVGNGLVKPDFTANPAQALRISPVVTY